MPVAVTIHSLAMEDAAALRPRRSARPDLAFVRVEPPWPELNRFFYTEVGAPWHWTDRLAWSLADWLAWLSRPGVQTWVLTAGGLPAGYCELRALPAAGGGAQVEITFFGLLSRFQGVGLGAHLLTCAVECAWAMGARRVVVSTCSLDHPGALANYRAAGFRRVGEEIVERELGPAPGASPRARG